LGLPDERLQGGLRTAVTKDEHLANLDIHNHGIAELAAWADSSGIESGRREWIDECWLKVSVSSRGVAEYLDMFLAPEVAAGLKAKIETHGTYKIGAEDPF
jgi:hypothetical protein